MVFGPLVKSVLKKTVEELPEDFAMKSESVPNMLLKKGVKPEELKFAKLGLPEGKVTKADLVKAEVGRQDQWDIAQREYGAGDTTYDYVTLRGEEDNPSYTERVYKWAASPEQANSNDIAYNSILYQDTGMEFALDNLETAAQKAGWDPNNVEGINAEEWLQNNPIAPAGYESSHFQGNRGYLMHARTIDQDLGDGKKTRTILELQSDLHQQGRQHGYATEGVQQISQVEVDKIKNLIDDGVYNENESALQEAKSLARNLGWNPRDEEVEDWVLHAGSANKAPRAPLESNWLRKLMEFEVAKGIEDGAEQIAIPLTGKGTQTLGRGEGVSRWYETVVKSTADKLAKQTGGVAELRTAGAVTEFDTLSKEDLSTLRRHALEMANVSELSVRYAMDATAADEILAKIGKSVKDYPDAYTLWEKSGDVGKTGTDYIVIKPGDKAKTEGFQLYAGAGASVGALTVANAMNQGFKEDEVTSVLKEQGYSDAEIQAALAKGKKAQIALSQGFTEDEVRATLDEQEPKLAQDSESKPAEQTWQGIKPAYNYLTGETDTAGQQYSPLRGNYTPTLAEKRDAAYQTIMSDKQVTARELVTSLQVLQPALTSLTSRAQAFTGNGLKAKQVAQAEEAARTKIISLAKERGIDLQWSNGEYLAATADGKYAKVTPTMWDELWAAKGEATGGVAGALAGARVGATLAPAHPLAKLAGSAVGSVVGAATGAAAGAEADYIYNAIKQSEDMNAAVAANKALTAAEMSVIGDALGYPIVKAGSVAVRSIIKAKDFIKTGNSAGAYKSLKETMFLSDSEAQELTDKLSKVMAVPGGNKTEQRIASTVLTRPGAEQLVRTAAVSDPKTSQAIIQSIDFRAKDLLAVTAEAKGTDVGRLLREDLGNYVSDVKNFYRQTKDAAINAPRANLVKFNYDKLAIEPVLKQLEENIQDPAVLNSFIRKAEAIRDTSDSRTFEDLLNLRQEINSFKYNKRIANTKDFNAINAVLTNIDNAITQSANMVLPNAKEWLGQYAQANAKYAQMYRTNENVLAKALRSPKLTEAEVGGLLVKHVNTLDGTLENVLQQLPGNSRKRAENAIVDTLTNKYTTGTSGQQQAVNFVELDKALSDIVLTTPEARQMKVAINRLAEVFRNDPELARASGMTTFAKPAEFLTDNVATAFKMQSTRNLFRELQKYLPTERGRGLALISKVATLLENPLHAKTIREVMEDVGPELSDSLKQVQQQFAKDRAAGKDVGATRVKLYGDGKVLSVKGTGTEEAIPLHRIATIEQLKDVADAEGIAVANTKVLDAALKARGFKAVMQGSNKVRKL